MRAPFPPNEDIRIAQLRALSVLDSEREEVFDDLVRTAADLFDVPIALVSLVDVDRQWFKAKVGVDVCETSRDAAFCAHAILQSDVLVVPNATLDPRFVDNPLVTGEFHLRFYAGAQVVVNGLPIGTLCCIDKEPRQMTDRQIRGLAGLARQAAVLFEARLVPRHLEVSRLRFAAFLENAPLAAFIKDGDGRLQYVNGGFESLFETTKEWILGRKDEEWLPDSVAQNLRTGDIKVATESVRLETREQIPTLSGAAKTWHLLRFPLDSDGLGWVGAIAIDITDVVEREDRLQAQTEELTLAKKEVSRSLEAECILREVAQVSAIRFQHLFQGLPVACFTFDESGTVQEWNSAAETLWGIRAFKAVQEPVVGTAICEANRQAFSELRDRVFRGETVYGHEHTEILRDGTERILMTNIIPLMGATGKVVGALSASDDITERRRYRALIESQLSQIQDYAGQLETQKTALEEANVQLSALAATDGLTGICNHRTFQERLEAAMSTASRTGRPLSVAMIDVDKFKSFNDDFGHQAGDAVLKKVAAILKDVSRLSDTVARYGGEEFVVLMPDTDFEASRIAAERLRTAIANAAWPDRPVTASFGVSTLTLHMTRDDLMVAADTALYASKEFGRNRVTLYKDLASTPRSA